VVDVEVPHRAVRSQRGHGRLFQFLGQISGHFNGEKWEKWGSSTYMNREILGCPIFWETQVDLCILNRRPNKATDGLAIFSIAIQILDYPSLTQTQIDSIFFLGIDVDSISIYIRKFTSNTSSTISSIWLVLSRNWGYSWRNMGIQPQDALAPLYPQFEVEVLGLIISDHHLDHYHPFKGLASGMMIPRLLEVLWWDSGGGRIGSWSGWSFGHNDLMVWGIQRYPSNILSRNISKISFFCILTDMYLTKKRVCNTCLLSTFTSIASYCSIEEITAVMMKPFWSDPGSYTPQKWMVSTLW